MDKDLLKEKSTHLDIRFPFTVYPFDVDAYKNHVLHWHDDIEVVYMCEGKAVFQLTEGQIELFKGQVMFFNSGELHTGQPIEVQPDTHYYLLIFNLGVLRTEIPDSFQLNYINPLISNHYKLPRILDGESSWEKDILSQLNELVNTYTSKTVGFEAMVKASLYRILVQLVRNDGLERVSKEETDFNNYKVERLKKVLLYIHNNYSKRITVKELADEINMSKSHFSYFFKTSTGLTLIDYINHYRINEATSLLINSDYKILEIAFKVGFDNISYFIKTFKRLRQCTPSEIRALWKTT